MSQKPRKTKKMSQNSRAALIRLTTCAMMVALAIVLCRVLGFPQGGSAFRIEISFLPIAVVGVLYGPIWAAVAYGLTDFIGALLTTGINPFILICKIVFGLLMGLCFYNREKIGLVRNILFFVLAGALVDVVMMTPIFIYAFGYDFSGALSYRLIGYAVNTPVRILVFAVADKYLFPALRKHLVRRKQIHEKQ